MPRSYPLRWLALALGLGYVGVQCQESLSDDCTKTLTCPENEAPVLDRNCNWRYPSTGQLWTDGPTYDSAAKVWRWPDGKETATQTLDCNLVGIGDAGVDASPGLSCQTSADCDVPLVCDTPTNTCVECLTSSDCADNMAVGDAGAAIACDIVSHECVPCVANGDCTGDTPVCKKDAANSSRNECVQCTVDSNCGGDKPICDTTSNECTQRCTSSSQCIGEKSVCNLTTQLCVECTDTSNTCSGTASQCNTATNECVECTDDAPCTTSGRVCDTTSNNCVQCTSNQQCQNVPDAPFCDQDTNLCVQCLEHSQCTGSATSRCNPVSHLCVGCTENSQCEDGALCNVERGGVCVRCLGNTDCPVGFPVCETANGQCVECLTNAECRLADSARCETAAGPSQYTCVGCEENGDCSGGGRGLPGLCSPVTDTCVSCILNGDCSQDRALSRCGNGGECAVCLIDDDCGGRFGGLQGCLPNQGCVECTSDAHCTDTPATPVCKLAAGGGTAEVNTCVQCETDSDCTNPAASNCVNNACVPCVANTDCAHLDPNGATTAGGLGVCDTGTCVECTGPQREACGTNVCDSLAKTCTNRPAGAAGLCDDCVSDAECSASARCVSQSFDGAPIGNFCVPTPVAGNCDGQRPYVGAASVPTLDSTTPAAVCVLRSTTCPGLNDRTNTCDVDADCGADGVADGVCVAFGGGNQCTTPCSSENDCAGDCPQTTCAL